MNGVSRSSRMRVGVGAAPPGPCRRRSPGDRRDHRHLVAVGQRRRRVGVVAVPGEAERCRDRAPGPGAARRAPPRPPRHRRRRPARAGPRACRPARAGSRTGGRGPRSTSTAAVSRATRRSSRPSPTGRIVALKRGSARTAASNARSAAVFASSAAAGRVPETRPLHRTLSAAMSAPGSSRPASASRYASYSGLSASMKTMSNGPSSAGSRARTPRAPAR